RPWNRKPSTQNWNHARPRRPNHGYDTKVISPRKTAYGTRRIGSFINGKIGIEPNCTWKSPQNERNCHQAVFMVRAKLNSAYCPRRTWCQKPCTVCVYPQFKGGLPRAMSGMNR